MAQWRPDPTFYPSPKLAMQAPAEKHAFVAMLNPTHAGRPDALGVVMLIPPPRPTASLSASWTCRTPAMSYTISGGMPVVRVSVRMHRIRIWNGGI